MLVICYLGGLTKLCLYLVSCGSRLAVLLTILKSLFERQISQKVSCILCHAFKFHWTVFFDLKFHLPDRSWKHETPNYYELADVFLYRLLFSCQPVTLLISTTQYSASLNGALAHNLIWIRSKNFLVVKCSVCMVIWSRMIAKSHFWVLVPRNLQFLYQPMLLLEAWTFQKSSTSYNMILQGRLLNTFTGNWSISLSDALVGFSYIISVILCIKSEQNLCLHFACLLHICIMLLVFTALLS